MTVLNDEDLQIELVDFFTQIIVNLGAPEDTELVDTYTVGVGGETFHVIPTGGSTKYIRYFTTFSYPYSSAGVQVNGVNKYVVRDYYIDSLNKKIIWKTPLVEGDVVHYHCTIWDHYFQGHVYPSFSRESDNDGTLSDGGGAWIGPYPKIIYNYRRTNTKPFGIGTGLNISDYFFYLRIMAPANATWTYGIFDELISGTAGLEYLHASLRYYFNRWINHAYNNFQFYTFAYAHPHSMGPTDMAKYGRIQEQDQTFKIVTLVEI